MTEILNDVLYAGGSKPGKGSGGGSGGASSASDVSVSSGGFQILTGANVQVVLTDVDKKLASNEDFDSLVISLDVLSESIGGITEVPLSSLQADLHDGRPSHKAPGALVYDEFNTLGVIDKVIGQTASVATLISGGKGKKPSQTIDTSTTDFPSNNAVKVYVDSLIGNINTVLDEINGEVI